MSSPFFAVKNGCSIFPCDYLSQSPLSKQDAPSLQDCRTSQPSDASMQKKVFPFHFCDILLYWYVWKSTSLEHQNLTAVCLRGFSKCLCFYEQLFCDSGRHWYMTHGGTWLCFSLQCNVQPFNGARAAGSADQSRVGQSCQEEALTQGMWRQTSQNTPVWGMLSTFMSLWSNIVQIQTWTGLKKWLIYSYFFSNYYCHSFEFDGPN